MMSQTRDRKKILQVGAGGVKGRGGGGKGEQNCRGFVTGHVLLMSSSLPFSSSFTADQQRVAARMGRLMCR